MLPDYMSVADAADRLSVSHRRVRQLIEEGELEASRNANAWLINPASVERRLRHQPASGRPVGSHRAWSLACLADFLVDRMLDDLRQSGEGPEEAEWPRASRYSRQLTDALAAIGSVDSHAVDDDPKLQRQVEHALQAGLAAVHAIQRAQKIDRAQLRHIVTMQERAHHSVEGRGQRKPAARVAKEDRAPMHEISRLRNAIAHGRVVLPKDLYRFRSRSNGVRAFYAHPSVLPNVRDDARVILSGAHAAAFYGADLFPDDHVDAYVHEESIDSLCRGYALEPMSLGEQAPVWFRPVDSLQINYSVAPRLLVAADLFEVNDARSRAAASELLDVLIAAIHWHDARA